MVFVVDDVLIAAIVAAAAASAAGTGLLSASKSGGLKSLKNKAGQELYKFKFDGALPGVDPVGTKGHTVDGYPVNSSGERIVTDGSVFDRMNMSSYDILAMSNAVSGATDFILGSAGSASIFNLKYPRGSGSRRIAMIKNKLKNDPAWISSIVEGAFGEGSGFKDWDPKAIVKTFGNMPVEVGALISGSKEAQKKLLDQLKSKDPTWNIPIITEGKGVGIPNDIEPPKPVVPTGTEVGVGQATGDMSGDINLPGGAGGTKIDLPGLAGSGTETKLDPGLSGGQGGTKIDIPPIISGGGGKIKPDEPEVEPKVDPKDPKKKDPKKEPKPPRFPDLPDKGPRQDDSVIKETPIPSKASNKPKKGVQWYPTYNMGGQNILKITDTERLEELKNWSLFDLVTPLLQGDPDNLLSIQNEITQAMRFTNTYASPRMEPPLPPLPDTRAWQYPHIDAYPTPYPMRLDNPQSLKLYYDNWSDQSNQYLNQKLNMLSGPSEPDLQQIVNAQSKGWSAIDPLIAKKGAGTKWSLLEDIDSSNVDDIDIMIAMSTR